MRSVLTRAVIGLGLGLFVAGAVIGVAMAGGTPPGTNITNQATVDFTDSNGNPLQTLSNIVTTIVSQAASVTVDPDRASSATPGDIIYYAHNVTNGGNGNDTIDLTAVSSNGWTTALYLDVDASGTFTPADTLLVDTDGDTIPDTNVMIADAVVRIIAAVTVPPGTANGTSDTMIVTGTSSFNVSVSDTATDITSINAPSLNVVKSVGPAGPQPPGTVLTYTITITNNGAGTATAVVLTDPIPTFTTYVPGSITLNAVGKTDAALDDEADFNVTLPGGIGVAVGNLATAGSATVTFQVTID